MNENKVVLGLVGSPNKSGRTNELVSASLEGASRAGAAVELIQMSDCVVGACKDCLPWVCNTNQKCIPAGLPEDVRRLGITTIKQSPKARASSRALIVGADRPLLLETTDLGLPGGHDPPSIGQTGREGRHRP